MSRRKQISEVNIGSDSFLDVLANIVGILIILIVIAGIRVSRAPVNLHQPTDSAKEVPRIGSAIETPSAAFSTGKVHVESTLSIDLDEVPLTVPIHDEPEEALEAAFVESTRPPDEMLESMRNTRQELKVLSNSLGSTLSEIRELEEQQATGRMRILAHERSLQELQEKSEIARKLIDDEHVRLQTQASNLSELKSQINELISRPADVKSLKHRVTPVSRVVVGDQLHFRLARNRVSQVPMDDLLASAMRQANLNAEKMSQSRTRIGTVGPLGGYMLQYKLQAVPATVSERARFGPGIVRIALTSFQIEPDVNLIEETAEQALGSGSSFDISMQTAEPGTTFTMWVYPDSFPLYRRLRDRLHESGFVVAGRPIPNGVPIAGSPNGTVSEGQ